MLSKKFNNSSLINVTSDIEVQEYIRKQSSIFRKVVSRCVLYPLGMLFTCLSLPYVFFLTHGLIQF